MLANTIAQCAAEVESLKMNECQFGQETCMNCGWDEGDERPKSEVKFVNGDAVCPECGELCDYYDYRDE